jgi:ribonuclease J
METIFNVAKKAGRKVAIIGRSMHKMITAVSETSYFSSKFKESVNSILNEEEAASMPPEKVLLICTGSQGEARSALYKLARGENKAIKLGKTDVVVFSSKVIPGNELDIRGMQNLLVRKETEVVTTDTEDDIHVSGHPSKKAIEKMYKWLNPKSFIPVHGDMRMLSAHKKFAEENGLSETLLAESGDVISFTGGKLKKIIHKDVIFNAIDGNDLIPLNSPAIRERTIMSYNGHISISFLLSAEDKIIGSPSITTSITISGIYVDEENDKKFANLIYQIITTEIVKNSNNIKVLTTECENSIKKLMARNFDKKPLVSVHIHKV